MSAARYTDSSRESSFTGGLLRLFANCYCIGFLLYPFFFFFFRQKITAVMLSMLCNSLLTMFFYRADKSAAQAGAERIPEKILHFWELTGGWPGALIARRWFHHKNRKLAFLLVAWLMILFNLLLIWGAECVFRKTAVLIQYLKN